MKALTLHQARAWQIVHGDKRVENRSWKPNSSYYGQRIAIHAGSNPGHREVQSFVRSTNRTAPKDKWPTGIVGTVRVLGVLHRGPDGKVSYEGVKTPSARFKAARAARSPHFAGPYGWVLDDAKPLNVPVHHNGRLQLWEPDKWEHSHEDERPGKTLMTRMIHKTVAQADKTGTGAASAG
jgi:hypothetical protein